MTAIAFAVKLFDWLPALIQGATGAIDLFQWGAGKVKAMVGENRDPTDDEWLELDDRINTLRQALHTD